jgi:hypothetical protein
MERQGNNNSIIIPVGNIGIIKTISIPYTSKLFFCHHQHLLLTFHSLQKQGRQLFHLFKLFPLPFFCLTACSKKLSKYYTTTISIQNVNPARLKRIYSVMRILPSCFYQSDISISQFDFGLTTNANHQNIHSQ